MVHPPFKELSSILKCVSHNSNNINKICSISNYIKFKKYQIECRAMEEEEKLVDFGNAGKKVLFRVDNELCVIHPMIHWNFAYRKADGVHSVLDVGYKSLSKNL